MTPERKVKFENTVARRQFDLTVVLENVHDPHNIGAVLRSCDSVGVHEIFVLYNDLRLQKDHLELGKKTTAGTRKWIEVRFYTDTEACFRAAWERYDHIYATHLGKEAEDLYQIDLTRRVALLFGNEMTGLSDEAMAYADGNYIIPQVGMVESLNISVACAVSLYEAYRQRYQTSAYLPRSLGEARRAELLQKYFRLHSSGNNRAIVPRINP